MRISIFGMGYVGAVSLACLSRDGHTVTGVDIDKSKLEMIANGRSPIVEHGIIELMAEVVRTGRVKVTNDAARAISETELSFVCVGTPSKQNGDQDLSALIRLSEQIGAALLAKDSHHTVVVRSTIRPGTLTQVVIPLLEQHSGKKATEEFSVCFQPEFLREGSSIADYDNPPMTVVGTQDDVSAEQLRNLFGDLPCRFISTDIVTAESLKYACNAFHALKVTFANEVGRICQAMGADSQQVMSLLCEDKQLNISSVYLRPGFAFGGSCLPKDLRALLYMAKSNDVDVPMLEGILPSNRIHVEHALEIILAHRSSSVGIIGLSFKSGTDDLRESPLVELVERLIGKGVALKIYDPEVHTSRLIGANKRYIEEVVPHIGSLMCDSLQETISNVGTIVVGLSDKELVTELYALTRPDQFILDLAGLSNPDKVDGEYRGICW